MTRRFALSALCANLFIANAVVAGEPEPRPLEAGLVEEGFREFQDGHFSEALKLFEDAIRAKPSAKVLRAIAKTHFELRAYTRVIEACDRALRETREPLTEDLRADVTSLRERALSFTNEVMIDVRPPHAALYADGQRVSAPLRIDLGAHTFRGEAAGYFPHSERVEVFPGPPLHLSLTLLPEKTEQASTSSPPSPLVPGLVMALSGGVVLASSVFWVDRGSALARCEDARSAGSGCSNADAIERERTLAITGVVLGSVVFLGASYFFVRALTASTPKSSGPRSAAPFVISF